jgi:hypothetical protein
LTFASTRVQSGWTGWTSPRLATQPSRTCVVDCRFVSLRAAKSILEQSGSFHGCEITRLDD